MTTPQGELTVVEIAGNRAVVQNHNPLLKEKLAALGFSAEGQDLTRLILNDGERRALAKALLEMDALFTTGADWSPAELMSFYREQGLFDKQYRVIAWKSPQAYEIRYE